MSKFPWVFRWWSEFISVVSKAEASPDLSLQDAVRLCGGVKASDGVGLQPTLDVRNSDVMKSECHQHLQISG